MDGLMCVILFSARAPCAWDGSPAPCPSRVAVVELEQPEHDLDGDERDDDDLHSVSLQRVDHLQEERVRVAKQVQLRLQNVETIAQIEFATNRTNVLSSRYSAWASAANERDLADYPYTSQPTDRAHSTLH